MTEFINDLYRFRMLVIGVYVGIAISSTYGFSIFTEHLKNKYHFTQGDITTISTVGNCCGYFIFPFGILYDYTGPKPVLVLAGFLASLGFLLFGLVFDGVFLSKPGEATVVHFSIFNAILYFGCPAMDVSCLMPLVLNFPLQRGFMVIIQKTFSGLGTSVLMLYFSCLFKSRSDQPEANNYSGYAYFVSAQIIFVSLLGAIFIDLPPYFYSGYRSRRLKAIPVEEQTAIEEKRQEYLNLYMRQPASTTRLFTGCGLVFANLIFLTVASTLLAMSNSYSDSRKITLLFVIITFLLMLCFVVMALPFQWLGSFPSEGRARKGKWSFFSPLLISSNPQGHEISDANRMPENESNPINLTTTAQVINDYHGSKAQIGEAALTNQMAANLVVLEEPFDDSSILIESDGEAVIKDDQTDFLSEVPHSSVAKERVTHHCGKKTDAVCESEQEKVHISTNCSPLKVAVDPKYDGTFWSHLLTLDLWGIWIACFGMWGTGTVMIMNAAQIYRSTNYGSFESSIVALYVALIGVGSAIGRIGMGVFDMKFSSLKEIGRSSIVTVSALPFPPFLLFTAYVLFTFIPARALSLPFLLGSMGNGAGWGIGILAVRIMYSEDLGKHYNFLYSSGVIATIALNRFMFGGMYDNEARRLNTSPQCNEPICIRNQMFILMAINCVSFLAALFVAIRFRRFVKRKIILNSEPV